MVAPLIAITVLLLSLLASVAPGWAQPVTPPGTWASFPASTLRPSMGAAPWNPVYIFDYSGGTFDATRGELLVWGGGHGDYPGNEVYAFSVATGVWTGLTQRSPYTSGTVETLVDGRPDSRHTYACIAQVTLPGYDGFFCHGGSLWSAGWPVNATWFFHRDTLTWESLGPHPLWGQSDYGATSISTYAVFDQARGRVLVRSRNNCFSYTFATRTFGWEGNCSPGIEVNASADFDPTRRIMVILGGGVFEVWNTATVPWTLVTASLVGDQTPKTRQGTGLIFDPVDLRYLAHVGGQTLYAINRDTWAVTTIAGAGANPGSMYSSSGNMGRFRYVASTHGLVVVNTIDTNVFYFKLGSAPVTFALTLSMAGTGTGTVSGGGAYVAGAIVTLTATSAAGSTFAGWAPAPCAASFPMPPNALTCVATFTLIPPQNPRVDITVTKPVDVDVYVNGVLVP